MKKILGWIKDNQLVTLLIAVLVVWVLVIFNALNSSFIKEWASTKATNITLGDILAIVIAHAYINRSEIKK